MSLTRVASSPLGTLGELQAGDFRCVTMEPPWRDNEPNVSCIPAGEYPCLWRQSPRYGWTYAVAGVPGRSAILIHAGNTYRHTRGCILPGARRGALGGLPAVLLSRDTTRRLFQVLKEEPFLLEVSHA